MKRILIVKLGDFWLPNTISILDSIFDGYAKVEVYQRTVEIGEPDYKIGNFIEEYSFKYLFSQLKELTKESESEFYQIVGILNKSIEKNYFGYFSDDYQFCVITIKDVERLDVDLESYLTLGIVENFIAKSDCHEWHREPRRCVFDFCGYKTDIKDSSKYLGLCNSCEVKLSLDSKTILQRLQRFYKEKESRTMIYMPINKVEIKDSQVVGVGDNNTISGNTFNQQINSVNTIDFELLKNQLLLLRESLTTTASSAEQYIAIGEVANAEKAAEEKDESKVVKHLKAAGTWAFDTAKDIGVDIVTELLKKQAGL